MKSVSTRRTQGFTLLEIMLVLGIVAFLASAGILAITKIQASSRRKQTQITVSTVETAMAHYNQAVGLWPDDDEGLGALITAPDEEALATKWRDEGGPFLKGSKLPKDAWGRDLIYKREDDDEADTTGIYFRVYSPGPNGEDDSGADDDIPLWAEDE